MTVASTQNRKTFAGDDATTSFATSPVVFFATSDLLVYVTTDATGASVLLTEGVGYTVSGGDESTGAVGTVDTSTGSSPHGALLSGTTLVILRELPLLQGADFVNNDASDADVSEAALDRLVMTGQRFDEKLERSVKLPDSDITGKSMELPTLADRASKTLGFDADGGVAMYDPASAVTASENVTFVQSGSATIAETVAAKIQRGVPLEPQDWMTTAQKADVAALTFGENVTTPLKAFYDACIVNGHRGHIPYGGYLITKGVLVFDNAQVDQLWPEITTDGYDAVEFRATASTDAAFIAITNGTAASATEQLWRGGSHGGVTFKDTSGATATSAHGMLLRGIEGLRFGYMRGIDLRADTIRIEQKLFGGTNPDPYHVGACDFEGVEGYGNVGMAFNNDNGVGLSHNTIRYIRAVNCVGGVMRGLGTCNEFLLGSAGGCSGWAIDDADVQSLSRVKFGLWELDNVENGVRLNNGNAYDLGAIRFVHRFQTGLNTDADYWPRECLSFGYSASPNLDNVVGNIWHRVSTGGVKADVGTFANFNSAGANVRNVKLDMRMSDEAAFGFDDADYYDNLAAATVTELYLEGRQIAVQKDIAGAATSTASTVALEAVTAANVSDTNDTFTVTSNADRWVTGQGVTLTTTGTLPAGLALATSYWIIRDSATTIKFATSHANSLVPTAIDLTDAGSGTHSVINGVSNGGFAGAQSRLVFPTELYDRGLYFSTEGSYFTIPYTGLYRLAGCIQINVASGTRVRLSFIRDRAAVLSTALGEILYSPSTNISTYKISGVAAFNAGDKVWLAADHNAAGKVDFEGGVTANRWEIEAVGARA